MILRYATLSLFGLLICITPLASCGGGGGGGGGSDDPVSGFWRAVLETVENTCSKPLDTYNAELRVHRDGDRVVVDSGSDDDFEGVFEGVMTSENSFIVSRTRQAQCTSSETGEPVPDSFAANVSTYEFTNISGGVADITWNSEFGNCSTNSGSDFDSTCLQMQKGLGEK